MKLLKKLTLSALIFAGAVSSTFALDPSVFTKAYTDSINSAMDDFASELGFAVPQAAVQQNVYADAFIGKIFPSAPPHFAAGINAGYSHLSTAGLAKGAEKIGITGVKDSYYFPVFNFDIRIGGVFLPFDVGFSFMTLDVSKLNGMDADFTAEFTTFAFDVRYALLEDGLITPAVSVCHS